jgi:hypothetical protein
MGVGRVPEYRCGAAAARDLTGSGLQGVGCLPQQVLQPDRDLLHLAPGAMGGQEHRNT